MQLTENFHLSEFHCKNGEKVPEYMLHRVHSLADNLQVLRYYIGKPIHINSAYRTPSHNAQIGGVPNSTHTRCLAVDISCRDVSPKQMYKAILKLIKMGKIDNGGVGLYNGFVHYDIDNRIARWGKIKWYQLL